QYNRDLSVLAIKTYGEMSLEKRKEQYESRMSKQSKKRKRGDDDQKPPEAVNPPPQDKAQATEEAAKPNDSEARQPKKEIKPSFRILDALSASGLRALRYAHELPFVTSVKANDLSDTAAESIRMNAKHNGLEDKITVTQGDALALMYRGIADDLSNRDKGGNPGKTNKFDVIDLDPY
ncbi:N2,N2-dimethylguanosine tRNA methyltransferase, partial [Fusarium napiforme]